MNEVCSQVADNPFDRGQARGTVTHSDSDIGPQYSGHFYDGMLNQVDQHVSL